ncbi:ExeA family protein [Marinobacter oulmenensis]|uniref:General secretion pathway protein A n=1 Tax=Marinobacter oulmenensis TaxID=643747 RepID=A0A840UIL3_9GAMM|nr:ExeA family protein [Marinobacter oulmenensis]MBB5320667.1 general secretion pathway protein A [Marinobacter oulmenensis]
MYNDFFGFREPPFSIAPDPRYLYLSDRHREALAHMMYGVQGQGGFIVITGEVGTGKTTVCRCFIDNVPDHVDIALILNPRLSSRELLSAICDELGIDHAADATIKSMVDAINRDLLDAHARGRHKLLIIDEAQNLAPGVLEQLRLLTNLETSEKKLLQIVLVGQPELRSILALPQLRQLNQRVTARYHLDAIDRAELPAYLQHRLGVAGRHQQIFTRPAIARIYRFSGGIPRLINLVSDRALLGAYAGDELGVRAKHVRQAIREIRGDGKEGAGSRPASASRFRGTGLVLASVLLAVIATLWWFDRYPDWSIRADTSGVTRQGAIERSAPESEPKTASSLTSARPPLNIGAEGLELGAAFVSLFGLWDESYNPVTAPVACDHAAALGLACLEQRGSRGTLEQINRPAILTLRDTRGATRYLVLTALTGDRARIVTSDGPKVVSFEDLQSRWFGHFYVIWRTPESLAADGGAGEPPAEAVWLGARMMALADRLAGSDAENDRIKRMDLEQQVRWYQKQRGLTVDGIPGVMTLIHMNSDLGIPGPRLVAAAGEAR